MAARSTTGNQFMTGDRVSARGPIRVTDGNNWQSRNMAAGDEGRITSIKSANRVGVRFDSWTYVAIVDIADLENINDPASRAARDAERAAREAERAAKEEELRLKKEAEDARIKALTTPGPNDIQPDDPRLAWLWRKIENLPQVKSYCSIYDDITDAAGIPGRARNFHVGFTVDGLDLATNVQARSKAEAEALVVSKFATAKAIQVKNAR